ncbi:hypothetical protein GCM10010981_16300 [Dyella nitratireducens]|uniref:histidine kinase n=2 Tax=Dyella nitratireducens TaxID=1849580 RepID=A0ABQ1FRN6_9GAMM|nr:hypothetical protein GCM10010981_16300 [Dyella nitratireducens]
MVGRWIGLLAFMFSCTLAAASAPIFSPEEQRWIKEHPVVYFAGDDGRAPLSYMEGGVYRGLVAQYIVAIARKSGLRFERYPAHTWAENETAFLAGKIDVLPIADQKWMPQELSEKLSYTEPYFTSPLLVVTRADEPVILDASELNGKVVSVFDSIGTRKLMLVRFPKVTPLFTPTVVDALDAVDDQRAYAVIGAEVILGPLLRRKYHGLLSISGSIHDAPLSLQMAVRQDEPLLFSIVKKSLESLSAQETDIMQEQSMEQADYGAPTIRSLLRYYALEIASFAFGVALLAFFAYRAWAARKASMQSERVKSRFLAVMSHEIRTPINAILGSIDMLLRTPLSEHQQRFAHTASTAAEALLQLLDDVLDISKLDARRLQLELIPTDVAALVEKAVRVAEVKARDKGIPINVTLDHLQGKQLMLDPTRFRQILMNLLGNAVKFTEQGQIGVDVALSEGAGTQKGILSCSVTDSGIGIPESQQQHLFSAYSQADSATTRKYGGTGLGLTICKELVELMDGTIVLKSVEGVGTKVSFSMPVSLATQVEAAKEPIALNAASETAAAPHARILVVEDHPQNRFVLVEQLKTLGVEPVGVHDGFEALTEIERQSPALILMDCHMPGMDGYETTRRIRQREAERSAPHVPIIAISAASDAQHLKRCMDSGMDGVLKKPLRIEELQSMLQVWLEQPSHMADEPADTNVEPTDIRALYQTSMAEDIQAIEQAMKDQNAEEVAHFAHRIKGAALMLAAQESADAADRLEQGARSAAPPEPAQMEAMLQTLKKAIASYFGPVDSAR